MISFKLGQRVRVIRVDSRNGDGTVAIDAKGTVVRLRRIDNGAYIELDSRSLFRGVHNFPLGDTRERHVLAYPQNCDPLDMAN